MRPAYRFASISGMPAPINPPTRPPVAPAAPAPASAATTGPAAASAPTPGIASAPIPTSHPSTPPSAAPAPAPVAAPSGAFELISGTHRLHGADGRDLEGPVSGARYRRPARTPSRIEGPRAHDARGGPDFELDAQTAERRHDALVHATVGREAGPAAHDRGACVEARGLAAPSVGALPALDRPRFRAEGGGDHRAVSRSPAACGGLLRRRKDSHSGTRSSRSDSAVVAGSRRAPRLRIRPPWHAVALRRAGDAERSRAGQDGGAAYE